MNNWKKYNNVWKYINTPNISKKIHDEFKDTIKTPDESLLYLPVHNINDIYEWYRLYNDAYLYKITDNYITLINVNTFTIYTTSTTFTSGDTLLLYDNNGNIYKDSINSVSLSNPYNITVQNTNNIDYSNIVKIKNLNTNIIYYLLEDNSEQNYIDNVGHGVGMTYYANKDRAKTIEAWYPNLIKVKATSSDEIAYLYENNNFYKHSKDFIILNKTTNSPYTYETIIDNLTIDNINIEDNEKILLKNQECNLLLTNGQLNTFFSYIDSVDNINKKIKINLDKDFYTNDEFSDTIIVFNENNLSYKEYKIINKSVTLLSPPTVAQYQYELTIDTFDDLDIDFIKYKDSYLYNYNKIQPNKKITNINNLDITIEQNIPFSPSTFSVGNTINYYDNDNNKYTTTITIITNLTPNKIKLTLANLNKNIVRLESDFTYYVNINNSQLINIDNSNKQLTINVDIEFIDVDFNINNYIICSDKKYKVKSIKKTNISDRIIQYKLTLDTIDDISNITNFANISGKYYNLSLNNQNGVYIYKNNKLSTINEMNMFDKVHNQLVYTYLGDENQNNVYYLKRNDDKYTPYYTKYPKTHQNLPMIYSLGNPHLLECTVQYNMEVNPLSEDDLIDCGSYNINFNQIAHPDHDPSYTLDEHIYRLLYTDNDMARKIQMKNKYGPVLYKIENDVILLDLTTITDNVEFNNSEILNNYSYNKNFATPPNNFTINFHKINTTTPFNIEFEKIVNIANICSGTNNQIILDNPTLSFTNIPYNTGLIQLQILTINNSTTEIINSFNNTLYATNLSNVGTKLTINFKDVFSDNLIDDLFSNYYEGGYLSNFSHIVKVSFINAFEFNTTSITTTDTYGNTILDKTVTDNYAINLIKSINKTYLGHVYDFGYDYNYKSVQVNVGTISNPIFKYIDIPIELKLTLNRIRNNYNKDVYSDMTGDIITSLSAGHLEPYFRNVYGPNYNLDWYLNTYQVYPTYSSSLPFNLNTLKSKTIVTDYTKTNPTYFKLIRPFKDGPSWHGADVGTIIEYGIAYKEYMVKNIKPQSYCDITDRNGTITTFIHSHEFDNETNIGRLVIKDELHVQDANIDTLTFNPVYTIEDMSNNLETSNKTDNIANGNYEEIKPSTFSVANQFINYREYFPNLTGVGYKEFNEPVYTFFKRGKKFSFDEDPVITVNNDIINIISHTTYYEVEFGTSTYNIGDEIIVMNESMPNGIYIIENSTYTPPTYKLVFKDGLQKNVYYEKGSDTYIYDVDNDKTIKTFRRLKKDSRLLITIKRMAKMGVDNDYQPFKAINENRDSVETVPNLVSVSNGIGTGSNIIRFIDGLSYEKIINNVNGYGKYGWILHTNVETENAVVGLGKDPITGDEILVWYTGKWINGVWCNGIWIQGEWVNGTWVNGYRYAYDIKDNITNVDILYNVYSETFSTWKNGTWVNGINYNGIFNYVTWKNGYFEGGTIINGLWKNGIFNGIDDHMQDILMPLNPKPYTHKIGTIKHIYWKMGTMYSGHWNTGIWEDGTLNGGIFGYDAHISSDDKTRAIFESGTINDGIITTKNDAHNATIIYSAKINGVINSHPTMNSGTIIFTICNYLTINAGVIFGGYYLQSIDDISNKFYFNPEQWDILLGLSTYSHNKQYLYKLNDLYITGVNSSTPNVKYVNKDYNFVSASFNPSIQYTINNTYIDTDNILLNQNILDNYTKTTNDINNPFITGYYKNCTINNCTIYNIVALDTTINNSLILQGFYKNVNIS